MLIIYLLSFIAHAYTASIPLSVIPRNHGRSLTLPPASGLTNITHAINSTIPQTSKTLGEFSDFAINNALEDFYRFNRGKYGNARMLLASFEAGRPTANPDDYIAISFHFIWYRTPSIYAFVLFDITQNDGDPRGYDWSDPREDGSRMPDRPPPFDFSEVQTSLSSAFSRMDDEGVLESEGDIQLRKHTFTESTAGYEDEVFYIFDYKYAVGSKSKEVYPWPLPPMPDPPSRASS